jgi:putative restriction endonuclease
MADAVDAYLQLTEAQARAQWQSIHQRVPLARQVAFLPVETLLSYALFYLLNPHRFGGGNIDQVPPEVKALAATFKRSAGSLTNKMLNLDGSRANSARHEPELFIRLQEPGRFEPLYRRILKAARLEGFGEAQVPDFLGALDGDEPIALLGQEELGPVQVASALDQMFHQQRQLGAAFGFTETETSRLVEQRVRLGQHRFARAVLTNYRWTCGFCGFAPGRLRGYGLLIASHVKPWAKSDDKERADVANGICACPTHDSAFDAGLLTVAADLQIRRAGVLERHMVDNASLNRMFGAPAMRGALLVPAAAERPRSEFLTFHQANVFRG